MTVGEPDEVLTKGTYSIEMFKNSGPPVQEYSMTIYQEGSGTVTVSYG